MDWSTVSHAYGTAEDLPATIDRTRSADAAVRAEAWAWLRATCCHQRTRYPASVALVEPLAAHAADPGAPDRPAALALLADLAVGDADRALLGARDPWADHPLVGALRAAIRSVVLPHDDPDPAVRAHAARVAHAVGAPTPPADDPDPGVRAARVLAGDHDRRHLGDPDPTPRAAAAVAHGDLRAASGIALALPPPGALPWLGGDVVRLVVPTLATHGARDALLHLVAHADERRALDAVLPALRAAADRLPPSGGWSAATLPPALAAVARWIAGDRPWLGTPEVWGALPRLGLPGEPRALRQLLGLPSPPSVLDRRHDGVPLRDLGQRLGRSGAGGPSIRRVLDPTAAVTVHSGGRGHVPAGRAAAAKAIGALGRDAVPVLVALAEEAEHPLETLIAAMDQAAARDPDGVLAEVLARAPGRATPIRTWDPRGEVHHVTGPVVLLGLATRATPSDRPTDPALGPLAESALAGPGFHAELFGWLDRLPAADRVRWIDDALARRPADWTGKALARGLDALPDASIVAHLPRLDPIDVVAALPPRRVAALAPALARRTRAFLAERARWMRDAVRQEHERLDAALATKGVTALRAWRAADPTPVAAAVAPARPAPAEADAVARAVVDLVLEEPLLGWLLGRIERELGEATPTMGLRVGPGPRVALVVNPGWFGSLPHRVRVGALRHEVLHLLFGHPFRTSLAAVDLDAYGTAADLVVNEHPGRWPLPDDARCMPFGTPPLPPDGTLDGWYAALLEQRFLSHAALGGVWHSDHRMWREPLGRGAGSDATEAGAAVDGLVAEGVEALAGDALWGLDPALHAAVLGAVERHRSTLDWRRVLRTFAASSRRTVVRATLRRRSRRYGTFPGTRIRRLHRVAVAVDTSGSISLPLLHTFFAEIAAMYTAGSEVVVVECDAAVQQAWAYTGQPPREVHGRGGTAFEPVMRWLHGDVGRFDGLVYLTDGQGPAPTTRPPCAVLWVVTPDGDAGPHLRFGRAVKIPPGSDDLGSRRR